MQSIDFKAELRNPAAARVQCRTLGAVRVRTSRDSSQNYSGTGDRDNGLTEWEFLHEIPVAYSGWDCFIRSDIRITLPFGVVRYLPTVTSNTFRVL